MTQLPDVPQPLKLRSIDDSQRPRVDGDGVPQRIPNNLEVIDSLGSRISGIPRSKTARLRLQSQVKNAALEGS
jgi:hypothetical protein